MHGKRGQKSRERKIGRWGEGDRRVGGGRRSAGHSSLPGPGPASGHCPSSPRRPDWGLTLSPSPRPGRRPPPPTHSPYLPRAYPSVPAPNPALTPRSRRGIEAAGWALCCARSRRLPWCLAAAVLGSGGDGGLGPWRTRRRLRRRRRRRGARGGGRGSARAGASPGLGAGIPGRSAGGGPHHSACGNGGGRGGAW